MGQPLAATAYISVWAGPFTPAILVILLLSIGIMIITSPAEKKTALRVELVCVWKRVLAEIDANFEKIREWVKRKRG